MSVARKQRKYINIIKIRGEKDTTPGAHLFELQSETKDDHQQSTKLRKCLSRSRCRKPKRVLF